MVENRPLRTVLNHGILFFALLVVLFPIYIAFVASNKNVVINIAFTNIIDIISYIPKYPNIFIIIKHIIIVVNFVIVVIIYYGDFVSVTGLGEQYSL